MISPASSHAAQSAAPGGLRANPGAQVVIVFVRSLRQFSGDNIRPASGVTDWALPRGRTFPLRLRGRAGPLLFSAARPAGHPAERYTVEDLRREAARPKGCAPFCTISCVHQTGMLDDFRERPRETLHGIPGAQAGSGSRNFQTPALVGMLSWLFLDDRLFRGFFGKLMLGSLGLKSKPRVPPRLLAARALLPRALTRTPGCRRSSVTSIRTPDIVGARPVHQHPILQIGWLQTVPIPVMSPSEIRNIPVSACWNHARSL